MPEPSRRGPLVVIFLTVFIDLLGFGLVLPLLPIYADEISGDARGFKLGVLMASFSAMQFLFSPIWGRLSDRYGRRPIIMIGLAGSVVFYSLFSLASFLRSMPLLFLTRFGAGIAGATIPTAQAYIADTTTLETRSKGMALIGMAFGLGFTFGPLIGYLAIPSGHGDPGPIPGLVAAGLSLIALILAFFRLPESRMPESESAARKIFDWQSWASVISIPSIVPLLAAIFVCLFSFANFETTLSLLVKGDSTTGHDSVFKFSHGQVCLTFAYVGLVLALVQGGLVRRLSGKVSEGRMATLGACLEVAGFLLMIVAIRTQSSGFLFGGLTTVVSGFAFLMPSLNSLVSRRSPPNEQGQVLGVSQSVNSLARIIGSGIGIPLLKRQTSLPFIIAAVLMVTGICMISWAVRRGKDYEQTTR